MEGAGKGRETGMSDRDQHINRPKVAGRAFGGIDEAGDDELKPAARPSRASANWDDYAQSSGYIEVRGGKRVAYGMPISSDSPPATSLSRGGSSTDLPLPSLPSNNKRSGESEKSGPWVARGMPQSPDSSHPSHGSSTDLPLPSLTTSSRSNKSGDSKKSGLRIAGPAPSPGAIQYSGSSRSSVDAPLPSLSSKRNRLNGSTHEGGDSKRSGLRIAAAVPPPPFAGDVDGENKVSSGALPTQGARLEGWNWEPAYPDYDSVTEDQRMVVVGAVRAGRWDREDEQLRKPQVLNVIEHSRRIAELELQQAEVRSDEDQDEPENGACEGTPSSMRPTRDDSGMLTATVQLSRHTGTISSPPVKKRSGPTRWRKWVTENPRTIIVSAVVLVIVVVGAVVGAVIATGRKDGPTLTEAPTAVPVPTAAPTARPTVTTMPSSSLNLLEWSQIGGNIVGEAPGDLSGYSVSLSDDGQTLAVGSIVHDGENGEDSGHVRIYRLANGRWEQLGQDVDGEDRGDRSGRSVSLSANGRVVAIGAAGNADNLDGIEKGHTRVFGLVNETGWVQIGNDIDGSAVSRGASGWDISLSADASLVAIGDPLSNGGTGVLQIYGLTGNTWTQVGSDMKGDTTNDRFGSSVSLSADGRVVAASSAVEGRDPVGTGVVRVFGLSDNNEWAQIGDDIRGLGTSLALSANGTVVAAGAINDNGNGNNAGVARVYRLEQPERLAPERWVQIGSDLRGEAAGGLAGCSIALSDAGDVVAVGARGHYGINGIASGHVQLYRLVEEQWIKLGMALDGQNARDEFGVSVSLSSEGVIVAVGADLNDNNGDEAGHVRVFQLDEV